MQNTNTKQHFRHFSIELRDNFASSGINQKKSVRISQFILNSDSFKVSKNIALYMPIKNEIDITSILNCKYKNFYLPRCRNNELEFAKYEGKDSLISGKYNILEPTTQTINPEILDIIYIPALMANSNCYRLGYGKGFYDRFFKKYNINALKVIVLAKELISDSFVQDTFDYQCDTIISA